MNNFRKNQLNLEKESIKKLLIQMSVPMILAMLINGLYYLADAVFVGWGVGGQALGGLAVVFPLQMLAIALGMAIGIGSASLVSVALGNHDRQEASTVINTAVGLCIILGIILPVLLLTFQKQVLGLFGVTPAIYKYASGYYSYIVYGFIFILLSFLGTNTIKAEGNAHLAAVGMLLGSLLNIIFDPIFIFGFNMGTEGAALATVLARALTTIYLAYYYLSGHSVVAISKSVRYWDHRIVKKIGSLGIGVFLNQIGFSLLAMGMNLSLRYYGGFMDIAVYGVISRIYVFMTLPFLGLAQGVQPIIGYNYGARKIEHIRETLKLALQLSFLMGGVLFIILMLFPQQVLNLFTRDSAIINRGILPLRIMTLMAPLIGIQIISYLFFLSIKQPMKGLLISLSRQTLFTLPLVIIMPLIMGKMGIWLAYPVADILAVGLSVYLITQEINRLTGTYMPITQSFYQVRSIK